MARTKVTLRKSEPKMVKTKVTPMKHPHAKVPQKILPIGEKGIASNPIDLIENNQSANLQ